MSIIIIYTNFDGTITEKTGENTVFTEFYQSLLKGYKKGVRQDYKKTSMKEPSEIQSIFEAKFGKYNENFDYKQRDTDFLMSSNAVNFFHGLLTKCGITVNIVTNNRIEYIKAIFKYQGFSDKQINKLTIFDSGHKFADVDSQLAHQKYKVNRIYILDDNEADYIEMLRAVKSNGYNEKEIRGYNKKPGQFEWIHYLKNIKKIVPLVRDEPASGVDDLRKNFLPTNKPNLSSNFYVLKMMTIWAGIGLTAGLGIGFNLVETGLLSSFSGNKLGALAVGALIAVGCGLLSSVIGFDIAKGVESKPNETQKRNPVIDHGDSHEFMRDLERSLKGDIRNAPSVDVLPVPTSAKDNVVRKTEPLTKTFT
ncbi:hypothetical protein [Legionella longbeachae]|uniref:Dot/Icm T4SS effector n=1 Tax=Legionella longbeachae serogroup 1 (strain NSW150) TaxID=661367 RepID=D3HS03_LEGLN|nr:hypothetical protein [Legionella longbeachae]VEE02184.1 Dot/Icm T4SS effector [Legionella oakridgensis]HBD7396574.1 hypothetical protein [Legionella pneumophila]ARB91514.1 hypothetical protein A6J40_04635 [Legionella longbeachae]ARM32060.1 hypothetical protein B0B39_00230 [Legionella longbeachae]EEZ95189.1 conserved hypothetical protein [Legionella longbeachae D-4968]